MIQLFDRCVYTIIPREAFARGVADGRLRYTENKRWVGASRWLEEAREAGRRLPLVLADASKCRDLVGWGLIDDIIVGDRASSFVASPITRLEGRHQQQLTVAGTGVPIAKGHQRPYVLCRTPRFLDVAALRADDASLLDDHDDVYFEGAATRRMVVHRHREAQLREQKLAQAKQQHDGRLRCEVPGCGFDFEERYGELGQGYAHVHHLQPLSERDEATPTRLDDLAVVCANCHAMIHRGGGCRSLDELGAHS